MNTGLFLAECPECGQVSATFDENDEQVSTWQKVETLQDWYHTGYRIRESVSRADYDASSPVHCTCIQQGQTSLI